MLQLTSDGRGVVTCLELPDVTDKPMLFSTFMMWMLAELYHNLPEAGDLPKPRLVFFFDEAHLLFEDASEGVSRSDRAGRPPDPLQRSRSVFRDPDSQGCAGGRAGPARQPDPARAAGPHPGRRQGVEGDGANLSQDFVLRSGGDPHVAGDWRGGGHGSERSGVADAGRRHSAHSALRRAWPRSRRRSCRPISGSRICWRSTGRQLDRESAREMSGRPDGTHGAGGRRRGSRRRRLGARKDHGAGCAPGCLPRPIARTVGREVVRGIFGLLGAKPPRSTSDPAKTLVGSGVRGPAGRSSSFPSAE